MDDLEKPRAIFLPRLLNSHLWPILMQRYVYMYSCKVLAMRTTLNLNDELLIEAKAQAARRRTTLTNLVEQGLSLVISQPSPEPGETIELPVFKGKLGVHEGVDLTSNRSMFDACDADS